MISNVGGRCTSKAKSEHARFLITTMSSVHALSIRNVHAASVSSSMLIGVLRVTDIISLSLTLMKKFYIRDYELLAIYKTNKSYLQELDWFLGYQ
jgi:hypothetical protein